MKSIETEALFITKREGETAQDWVLWVAGLDRVAQKKHKLLPLCVKILFTFELDMH